MGARGVPRTSFGGERIGEFVIERLIASGGMGTVYRGRDADGRPVAIKILHPHLVSAAGSLDRFRREAELGLSVEHPNVVRTLAVGEAPSAEGTLHYLVMEYVEGQTLRQLSEELGPLPEELCRRIGIEIAKGLDAIHAVGAVHRDLKPDNVVLTPDHSVKIMDLGLARLREASLKLSNSGTFVGSALYAAPEQFEGRPADPRTDTYALGLVLYELATGEHPSRAEDFAAVARRRLAESPRRASELRPGLTPFFDGLLHALLARDPRERPADPRSLLEEGEASEWWKGRSGSVPPRQRRIDVARETPVFGREPELGALASVFESARGGDGRVVWVDGEAGVGKTRLMDEFVNRLEAGGAQFRLLFGAYLPGGAATSRGAFSTAFREHFGAGGSAPWLEETPRLVPAFDALLRGEPVPPGAVALTGDSIPTVFVHATRALAREKPTVIFIDDLHNAPAEGQALFAALAHAVARHRVLLIGATRGGEMLPGLERVAGLERIRLTRLGTPDVTRLIEASLGSRDLARDLGSRVAERGGGNPFFLLEIAHGLREALAASEEGDGRARRRALAAIRVPDSVADLIRGRLAAIAPEDRDLLDVASCCGVEFDPGVVAEAASVPVVPALKRFARIERDHGLVRTSGRRYAFDHSQIAEFLYAALHEQLRERYHAAIAGVLERRGSDPVSGAAAAELCRHCVRGGLGRRAMRTLDAALHHIESGHLHDQAVDLAREALAAPGAIEGEARVSLLLRVAARLEMLGRTAEERAALDEALGLADGLEAPLPAARVRAKLGWHLCRTSRYDEAEEVLVQALATARATGDRRLEGDATGTLGNILWARGRTSEALAHAERHLALARETGDLRGQAAATGNIGNALRALHRYDEARARYEEAFALFSQLGDGRGEAVSIGNLGNVFEYLGRHDEALRQYKRHLAHSREVGYRRGEMIATGNLGIVLSQKGLLSEAWDHLERGLELAREMGDPVGEAATLDNMAPVAWAMGDAAAARRLAEEAAAICLDIGERRIADDALVHAASFARLSGDLGAAAAHVERACDLGRELGDKAALAAALAERARLRMDAGDGAGARADFDEAIALADAADASETLVIAATCRAVGDPARLAEAERCFEARQERMGHESRMNALFLLWRAGRKPEHLAEARRLLEEMLRNVPDAARAKARAEIPLHRDIDRAWREPGASGDAHADPGTPGFPA